MKHQPEHALRGRIFLKCARFARTGIVSTVITNFPRCHWWLSLRRPRKESTVWHSTRMRAALSNTAVTSVGCAPVGFRCESLASSRTLRSSFRVSQHSESRRTTFPSSQPRALSCTVVWPSPGRGALALRFLHTSPWNRTEIHSVVGPPPSSNTHWAAVLP